MHTNHLHYEFSVRATNGAFPVRLVLLQITEPELTGTVIKSVFSKKVIKMLYIVGMFFFEI